MSTGLIETVNVDYYGDVTVHFDYEDERYYINEVWHNNDMVANHSSIEGWLFADIIHGLEARREYINSDIDQYNNED